ncbi:hypothetical protein CFC21_078257 [Triticum aestivum]|uniref:Uncharacterized protein n=2 Tax=Triticum aestivum TaxID=4565 RepID=A0A3B6MU47_WHEAT|nr:uncharacterized protein LOC123125028 [Triticum aestivum]KAF7073225.1 hypothetical protein CFC21_078257 [Triticum aestivum]
MGSCASRSPAPAAAAGSWRAVGSKTAKVIRLDGSMAQYAALVTAREALVGAARASSFLCSSDELRLDAPARALAADELLQPGWLYFVLPLSMLRRPLSGQEMTALAVRASSALAVASGISSPTRGKNGAALAGANGKRRKVAARVAPLADDDDVAERDGGWDQHLAHGKYGGVRKRVLAAGDVAAGKARRGDGYGGRRSSRHRRRRAGAERLSAILEADDF